MMELSEQVSWHARRYESVMTSVNRLREKIRRGQSPKLELLRLQLGNQLKGLERVRADLHAVQQRM